MKSPSNTKPNITIQTIADAVNISASTVSRALKNHPKISAKTKEKVWETAKRLGYLPNIPVYMQKKKSAIVFILIDKLNDTAIQDFISSAQEHLITNKFQPIIKLILKNEEYSTINNILDSIEIAGVISLLDDTDQSEKILQIIINYNIPLAAISNSKLPNVHISPDIYNGIYLATKHLLKQGAKNIVLIIGDHEKALYTDMANGFEAAFKNTAETTHSILKNNFKREVLKYEFEQLFTSSKKSNPDAIITCNNLIACELHSFLSSNNIQIPKEVMLISFGNEIFLNFMSPSISTIEYSSSNLGKTASNQLINIINNNPITNKILIEPVKLIIRNSSMR